MEEQNKKFCEISIWLTIILFVIRCLISKNSMNASWEQKQYGSFAYSIYGYAGEAILLTTILMTLFDKVLWKTKLFMPIARTPVLAAYYRGTLKSDYDHKAREAELFIKQTFLRVAVNLKTSESFSNSINCEIRNINDCTFLLYNYLNDPHGEIQGRSPIHYGTARFDLTQGTDRLEGNYYTSRNTRGSMKFERR
jgi:hypothetical protein